jgi:hypothetical protein
VALKLAAIVRQTKDDHIDDKYFQPSTADFRAAHSKRRQNRRDVSPGESGAFVSPCHRIADRRPRSRTTPPPLSTPRAGQRIGRSDTPEITTATKSGRQLRRSAKQRPHDGAENLNTMKFAPKATSAARSRLQECLSARSEVDAKLAELQGSIARLDSTIAAVGPAEAAIVELNEADDYAALRWATSGDAERPKPDVEAHDRLARELFAARASGASAERAKATLTARMATEAAKVPDIQRFADAAVCEILVEEAEPIVAEVKASAIALAGKIRSLEAVSQMALQIAEKGRHVHVVSAADHELAALGARTLAVQNPEPLNPTPPEALLAATDLLAKFPARLWAPIANAIIGATESFPAVLAKHTAAIAAWKVLAESLRTDSTITVATEAR